jgi:hypothetical protein
MEKGSGEMRFSAYHMRSFSNDNTGIDAQAWQRLPF